MEGKREKMVMRFLGEGLCSISYSCKSSHPYGQQSQSNDRRAGSQSAACHPDTNIRVLVRPLPMRVRSHVPHRLAIRR